MHLQLLISAKILFCFLFLLGCKVKNNGNTVLRYADFDLLSNKGIKSIGELDFSDYYSNKKPYIEIRYKSNIIDSIIAFNISLTPYYIKPFKKEETLLYEINKFDVLYGNRRTFMLVNKGEIYQYSFITPVIYPDSSMDCNVYRISNNKSYSFNCQIKQSDTIDFSNKLLNKEPIELHHLSDTSVIKNINAEKLTLVSYFKK